MLLPLAAAACCCRSLLLLLLLPLLLLLLLLSLFLLFLKRNCQVCIIYTFANCMNMQIIKMREPNPSHRVFSTCRNITYTLRAAAAAAAAEICKRTELRGCTHTRMYVHIYVNTPLCVCSALTQFFGRHSPTMFKLTE